MECSEGRRDVRERERAGGSQARKAENHMPKQGVCSFIQLAKKEKGDFFQCTSIVDRASKNTG